MVRTGKKTLVCVGQFSAPHGVKGGLKLKSFTQTPATLRVFPGFYFEGGEAVPPLKFSGPSKESFVVFIEGVNSPEEAARFKGRKIFILREDLSPPKKGEYYLTDLEGLSVFSPKKDLLGKVAKVYDFGAGPLLEITLTTKVKDYGSSLLVPFRSDWIGKIDLKEGTVEFDLTMWLSDEE